MILLVNPPNPPGRVSNKDMMGGFGQCYPAPSGVKVPPLDLAYAAAVLRAAGVEFQVVDCLGEALTAEGLLARLPAGPAPLIFLRTSTSTASWDMEVAGRLKAARGATIALFGPHVNLAAEELLAHAAVDAVIFDEPEYAIRDAALRGLKDCAGIWMKDGLRVARAPRRAPISELDELPFPAWDLLPYREYNVGDLMPGGGASLFMQTSRGCPYTCTYCPYPVSQGHKYRKRGPKNVVDEFIHLARAYGAKNVVLRDPEFTLDRRRIVDICAGLAAAKTGIAWRCETRADTLDTELLELMRDAGCVGINMGIESKSEEVCKKVERFPLKPLETLEILRKCRELGIKTFCFFIAGLPGDDWSTISETIGHAIALDPDVAQFTVATPYLGTGLHDWAKQHGFVESTHMGSVTGFEAMMRNEKLSSREILWLRGEAQRLVDLAHRRGPGGGAPALAEGEASAGFNASVALLKARGEIKRLVVYGTRGVSLAALRDAGLEDFAIVDDELQGRTLGGLAVLDPGFIKAARPDAVLVADGKRVEDVPYSSGANLVVSEGREERFFFAKKAARKLRRLAAGA